MGTLSAHQRKLFKGAPFLLQERPEDVPTGELPRNVLMTVDRAMVGTIAPGTRVTAVAIYSTVQVTA
jgi:DNA replication licensing factor MCM5